jgi:hypothetical protein
VFPYEVRFANQGYSVADLSINYYFVTITSVQKSRAQVTGWLLLFPLTQDVPHQLSKLYMTRKCNLFSEAIIGF